MKKSCMFAVLILLVLVSSFVFAQNDVGNNGDKDLSEELTGTPDTGGLVDIKEQGKEAGGKIEAALENEFIVPEKFQIPARILFGIKGEISYSHLIVLLALWVFMLLVVSWGLEISPFLNRGIQKWIGAIIITCLVAVSGAIRFLTNLFFQMGNIFGLLEKWPILAIIFAVVLIIMVGYGLSIFFKILGKHARKEAAEMVGAEIGALAAQARAARETREDLSHA